jgi:tetratricopeptide (TPR) repeat protein
MCLPLMAEGEFALVKGHLETVGKLPISSRGFLVNETERHFLLADLAVLERDEVALREYAPPAEELARRDGHILFQASAQRAWGVLHRLTGDYEQAEDKLNQALELFQGLETRWQIGRTFYEFAELALAKTDTEEARRYFSLALAAFEDMRAVPDAERTRAALASLKA